MQDDILTSPGHAMHVGWVKSELENHGLIVRYMPGPNDEWTARLRVVREDPAFSFELIVPPPS